MPNQTSAARPLVYDVGANRGHNVAYYLAKGFRVVAIDANPQLIDSIKVRFPEQMKSGDLVALNLGVGKTPGKLPFHVNSTNDVLSSFVAPHAPGPNWTTIDVDVEPLSAVVRRYGEAHFIKIDVEHYDQVILDELLISGLRPHFISAEAHSIDIACQLVAMGYNRFQLVNCASIGVDQEPTHVRTVDGRSIYHQFPRHAAGACTDDLSGRWMNAEGLLLQWIGRRSMFGGGWFDIHGTRQVEGASASQDSQTSARTADTERLERLRRRQAREARLQAQANARAMKPASPADGDDRDRA